MAGEGEAMIGVLKVEEAVAKASKKNSISHVRFFDILTT